MAAEGRTLYFQVGCQGCHGGGGGGGMATSVIDDAWTFGSDDEVLFRLIKGEIPEQTMPTVYSVLDGRGGLEDPGVHPLGLCRRPRPDRLVAPGYDAGMAETQTPTTTLPVHGAEEPERGGPAPGHDGLVQTEPLLDTPRTACSRAAIARSLDTVGKSSRRRAAVRLPGSRAASGTARGYRRRRESRS